MRTQQLSGTPDQEGTEETEQDHEGQPEEVEEIDTGDSHDQEEPEETDGEEGQPEFDIESLTPEQIQEIAKRGKSRLLQRIGELTARNRSLEEKIHASAPQVPQVDPDTNPFRSLNSLEDVNAKFVELQGVLEETDKLLEDNEELGPEDLIEFGGKEFTKKQIRQAARNARNAITKYLPAQAGVIQQRGQLDQSVVQYLEKVQAEVPEVLNAESDVGQFYRQLLQDPMVASVKEKVPGLYPQLPYILAHAIRSITGSGSDKPTTTAAVKPKAKVPGNPFGAGGSKGSAGNPSKKKVEQAENQFNETGSVEDFIRLRAQRLAQR